MVVRRCCWVGGVGGGVGVVVDAVEFAVDVAACFVRECFDKSKDNVGGVGNVVVFRGNFGLHVVIDADVGVVDPVKRVVLGGGILCLNSGELLVVGVVGVSE